MFTQKIGCTSIKDSSTGKLVSTTVLQALPAVVLRKKTVESDGYSALVLAVGNKREDKVPKPVKGQIKKAGLNVSPAYIKEVRMEESALDNFNIGDSVDIQNYIESGKRVGASGTSKGKGFNGVITRWGFSRGRETHGSNHHRRPGAIGMREWPGEVMKGKKMPGRMGGGRITIQGLKVLKIEDDLIALKGGVPGPNKTLIEVRI